MEKLKPSAWSGPKTATSHGELSFPPHVLLPGSTVAESGRENCAALWGKDPQRDTIYAYFSFFPDWNKNAVNILQTVLLEVLYVMEKDAKRSALMQVEFPSFTSRVTAWVQPVKENIINKVLITESTKYWQICLKTSKTELKLE